MIEKLKKLLKADMFYVFLLIGIAFFGIFIQMQYASDTYYTYGAKTLEIVEHFLQCGRFVTAVFWAGVKLLHLSDYAIYVISFLIALFCGSLSLYKLYQILSKDINNKVCNIILSILIIVNIFSYELFLYIEKSILWLSILMCILAVEQLIKYFNGNKKSILYCILFMLIANFSYQGTVAIFVAISMIYIIKYSENIKQFIKNNCITAICYGIPAIVNYLIVKLIFTNNRIKGEINLGESITKILDKSKIMLTETYGIIPNKLFLLSAGIVLIILILHIILDKKKWSSKLIKVLEIAYIIIGTLLTTLLPQLLQNTQSIWFEPRSTYAIASIIGLLLLYLYMNFRVDNKVNYIILTLCIVFISIQYANFQGIFTSHYIVNYMDGYEANQIQEEISKYEQENGIKITKVAFYSDSSIHYTYPGIRARGDTNARVLSANWARYMFFKTKLKTTFEPIDMDEEIYHNYFENKNWSSFSKEQLIFKNDELHLYVY